MSIKNLLILSGQDDRTKELVSLLENGKYTIHATEKISEAKDKISSSEIALILINYSSIVKAERNKLISLFKDARRTKFVIYDVPEDAMRRLAFYRLGAYRILDKKYTVQDIYYFSENTLTEVETDDTLKESHISGSLQDFNLPGLINIFGREKRNGVLRIQTPVSSGKIYFNNGNIYNAVAGNRKEDDALFYMLTWNKGWFSMRTLPTKKPKNKVQLSNIGLLLHGANVSNEFFQRVDDLGGISSLVRVINKGDLLQKTKDPTFQDFLEKLSEFRKIYDIIEFSPYQLLSTLDHLLNLKKSNNLEIRESADVIEDLYVEKAPEGIGPAEPLLSAEEVKQLRKNLKAQDLSSGKLLILGTKTCGKTDFIRQLNQGSLSGVRSNQDLDFTTIEFEKEFNLQVFGIVLDRRLTEIIEKLSEGLVGYIFLIDAKKEEELEYTNYLINHLINIYGVPWAIAVTNIDKQNTKLFNKIMSNMQLPDKRKIEICDVYDKEDVRQVVMSINPLKK
jgi:signal recognition particle receptor subunit beta